MAQFSQSGDCDLWWSGDGASSHAVLDAWLAAFEVYIIFFFFLFVAIFLVT